jgi:glycosyltransferase involved in cell wall biosynthesis
MKILMIAPEPFFEPRGTPFSEYFRIKALCKLGHTVDLVTYPLGRDKIIDGLRIFRSLRPPFVRSVKTGPSLTKIPLDFFLFFKVLGRLLRKKYDVIHTHEEACIMGVFFNKLFRVPHLYDMHSSLVQQMKNFQFTKSKLAAGFFKWIEKRSLKNAAAVIVICKALYEYASTITGKEKLTVIENFIDELQPPGALNRQCLEQTRQEIGSGKYKIILYTGTLEKYQGIPLLIDSMTYLPGMFRLVLIGGKPGQVEAVKALAAEKGLQDRVMILGEKEPQEIPYYLGAADVLVSPRNSGTNIPLKIYAYLKSGIPVVATDLYTHTQSLNGDIAILVEAEPEKFAAGIREAVSERGQVVSENARAFCRENYTYERYLELVADALKKAGQKKK